MLYLEENQTVLFTGDSITDAGRDRGNPENLGNGYVKNICSRLSVEYAELNLRFLNFGISGNRACDLKNRWKTDCLDHKPDILSILIGANDVWRRYDSNNPTSLKDFENNYRHILDESSKDSICQIVIMEPFVLPVPEDRKLWREDLDPKITIARQLAMEYAIAYVPLDGIFAAASVRREPGYWAADGVHPSNAGHMLIADAWLKHTGL